MNTQTNNRITLSKDGKTFAVVVNGQVGFFSANLVRYQLEIPYTKKNGMQVSVEDIKAMKQKSLRRLSKALEEKAASIA